MIGEACADRQSAVCSSDGWVFAPLAVSLLDLGATGGMQGRVLSRQRLAVRRNSRVAVDRHFLRSTFVNDLHTEYSSRFQFQFAAAARQDHLGAWRKPVAVRRAFLNRYRG